MDMFHFSFLLKFPHPQKTYSDPDKISCQILGINSVTVPVVVQFLA